MVSLGCRTQSSRVKMAMAMTMTTMTMICTHHSRGGDVDAGDGSWSHVICEVTEHHPVCQGGSQVTGQRHLQTSLNVLDRPTDVERQTG